MTQTEDEDEDEGRDGQYEGRRNRDNGGDLFV